MTIPRPFLPNLRDVLGLAGVALAGLAVGAGAFTGFRALSPASNRAPSAIAVPDRAWANAANPADLSGPIKSAAEDGLDPDRYRVTPLGPNSDPGAAGPRMFEALASYARDLHLPRGERMIYIDPELAPRAPALPSSGDLADWLRSVRRMNPVYEGLRSGLAWYRARWSVLPQVEVPPGPAMSIGSRGPRVQRLRERLGVRAAEGVSDRFDEALARRVREFRVIHGLGDESLADARTVAALNLGAAHYEKLIAANLDRARAIPAAPAPRYVVVDTAGMKLWLIDGGQVRDTIRVIVGKPGMETPFLAGLIRFAVFDPYWNVPPDLVRDRMAPRVLATGAGYLSRHRFEAVSGWDDAARVVPGESVDWAAVAQGRAQIRVRQLPGGDNMMGKVKFMLPNRWGIYLHDTPNKANFSRTDRRLSSGCVRVEDADRLGRWLFGGRAVPTSNRPEEEVRLPVPVPVYISYFTAVGQGGQVRFQPDGYRRDPGLAAALARQSQRPTKSEVASANRA